MLGRIFVYEPPRENLHNYAIFQGTNRAADATKAGLWVWPAGTIDERHPRLHQKEESLHSIDT